MAYVPNGVIRRLVTTRLTAYTTVALDRAKGALVAGSIEATEGISLATTVTAMRLEPILRAHAYMNVEQPPELWEADTEDALFLPLLGEIIAAALSHGIALEELTLNASNVVVEPPEDDEDVMAALPGEYVAITVRVPTDLGPDDTWHPSTPHRFGQLSRLHSQLEAAGARFAYVRRIPPGGSLTVFFPRRVKPGGD